MELPAWTPWIVGIVFAALGYCVGALHDAHSKLDKLQKQVEHLHTQLYDSGAFEQKRGGF